jgi:AraC-like DNA-binding protein
VIKMSELFSRRITCTDIDFKHAKGESDRSGKEFHLFNEIILFLGDNVNLISEKTNMKLKENTLVLIPKETYHQFQILGNKEDYHRCVFQFEDLLIAGFSEKWRSVTVFESDASINYLFSKLMEFSRLKNRENEREILKSYLTIILLEIGNNTRSEIEGNLNDNLTRKIIKYISENLSSKFALHDMSLELNASVSTLMHSFRKNMNISIYKYILKKRLLLAHMKIEGGESASVAAEESGFSDYSGFYRQYKKMFGQTPSKVTRK